jgi:hypothetical protein
MGIVNFLFWAALLHSALLGILYCLSLSFSPSIQWSVEASTPAHSHTKRHIAHKNKCKDFHIDFHARTGPTGGES